eukprot:395406-Prymnesium_polylepis.2
MLAAFWSAAWRATARQRCSASLSNTTRRRSNREPTRSVRVRRRRKHRSTDRISKVVDAASSVS